MEETEERSEKQLPTETDTDVESTQSRQKKGQMKSIFLSDSDEVVIVGFVKLNSTTRLMQNSKRSKRRGDSGKD